jgi:hypothetical protein
MQTIKENTPENFFYNDNFFTDLEALACELQDDFDVFAEGEELVIELSVEEPIVKFTPEWIVDRIDDDRFTEDGCEREYKTIKEALSSTVDFDKLNALIPKVYFGSGKMVKIKVSEIKEWL